MSGGSFDYAYQRALQFADELQNKLAEQGKDTSGDGYPHPTWSAGVSGKMSEIAALANDVGSLMKEAEWLYSGDTGEETFMRRIAEIEATRGSLRTRLVGDGCEACNTQLAIDLIAEERIELLNLRRTK